jgi:hypothetical protein
MCTTLDPIDPNDDCPLCNVAFKVRPLIRFEMGEYVMSRKKGYPDFRVDSEEGGPQYFHFDCVLARIDFPNNGLDGRCGVCGEELEHQQVVYRLTCGSINWDNKTFMEDLDSDGLVVCIDCCGSCVFNDLGEGDMEQGAWLLQLGEDTILEMFG